MGYNRAGRTSNKQRIVRKDTGKMKAGKNRIKQGMKLSVLGRCRYAILFIMRGYSTNIKILSINTITLNINILTLNPNSTKAVKGGRKR